jgi:hypothetical protein
MPLLTATRAMLRKWFFVSYLRKANERLSIVMRDEGMGSIQFNFPHRMRSGKTGKK